MNRIRIYQINPNHPESFVLSYMNWDYVHKIGAGVNPDRYNCVYDGPCEATKLEEIYLEFQHIENPNFNGHSLSVSDIVETRDGLFFCDSFGWRKIEGADFSAATMVQEAKK